MERYLLKDGIIEELCDSQKLSQEELAKELGTSGGTLSKYKSRKVGVPLKKMATMAALLGRDITALMYEEKKDETPTESENVDSFASSSTSKGIIHPTKSPHKFAAFTEGAMYCENFDPGNYLAKKEGVFTGLVVNGNICCSEKQPLYVPQMYITISGYRAWLKAVYPDASISTEERFIDKGVVVKVKVARTKDDMNPFVSSGCAFKNGRSDYNSLINFATADALKRAMKNQGFGLGLNWDSIGIELPTYQGFGSDSRGLPTNFEEYLGPVYCNNELVRDALPGYKESKSAERIGMVESISEMADFDRETMDSLKNQYSNYYREENNTEENNKEISLVEQAIIANNKMLEERNKEKESDEFIDDENPTEEEIIERF